jgi:predicted negative regulator of RcsB-dependent stress response
MNFTWILGLAILAILGFIGWAFYQKHKTPKV